jgi:hypothetical protein
MSHSSSVSTAQHSTAQHSTAKHSTEQHSTAKHSTEQSCPTAAAAANRIILFNCFNHLLYSLAH